jgi:hypothetical protein
MGDRAFMGVEGDFIDCSSWGVIPIELADGTNYEIRNRARAATVKVQINRFATAGILINHPIKNRGSG